MRSAVSDASTGKKRSSISLQLLARQCGIKTERAAGTSANVVGLRRQRCLLYSGRPCRACFSSSASAHEDSERVHTTTMSKRRERTSYADGCNGRLASFVDSAIHIGMPASIAFFSAHFPTSTQHKLCEQLQHRLCTLSRRGVDIGSPGRVSWLRVKF